MYIPRIKYTSKKRIAQLERNHGGEAYKNWRNYCLERDDHKCQFPGCDAKSKLQIHHIKTFARNPALRTNKYNGITLCAKCHRAIFSKEKAYEIIFLKVVTANEKRYAEKRPKDKDNS